MPSSAAADAPSLAGFGQAHDFDLFRDMISAAASWQRPSGAGQAAADSDFPAGRLAFSGAAAGP